MALSVNAAELVSFDGRLVRVRHLYCLGILVERFVHFKVKLMVT